MKKEHKQSQFNKRSEQLWGIFSLGKFHRRLADVLLAREIHKENFINLLNLLKTKNGCD